MRPDDDTAADGTITSLLTELRHGNRGVEPELAALVYNKLRSLAAAYMKRERRNHTLQPTALVNEAWERLADGPNVPWQNRAHFFSIAAHHMRQVLVDHARRRNAAKRGGVQQPITLHNEFVGEQNNLVDLIALNEALDHLKTLDPRACRIVELRFFGGLSFDEMAFVVGISTRSAKRDWTMARAWLRKELARS